VRERRVETADQRLAWMIVLATIPVGLVGLVAEHPFRLIFGKPVVAGAFLAVNGVILIAGERFRRQASLDADARIAAGRRLEPVAAGGRMAPATAGVGPGLAAYAPAVAAPAVAAPAGAALAASATAPPAEIMADRRLSAMGYGRAIVIGSAQILALLAGISRDGVTMVAGMRRGLAREDAVRFAFLLSTPVILAAGVLKIPDLFGPLGSGIRGQILLGSVLSGLGAYAAVRFLVRYLRTRSLVPFGIYCLVAGLVSVVYLSLAG
jgi:undecaprenyl-diphosphatase